MDTELIRDKYKNNSQKLKRARRAYAYRIKPFVEAHPESLVFFVHKAQKRGLYSQKSGRRDVAFGFVTMFCAINQGRVFVDHHAGWYKYYPRFIDRSSSIFKGAYRENFKPRFKLGGV